MVDEIQEQKAEPMKEETVEKRNTEKVLKIFSVVLAIFLIATLIYLKIVNPNFPLFWVIFLSAFILVISLLLYFGFSIFRKFQEKDVEAKKYKGNLPKPIALGELRTIVNDCFCNDVYANHCTQCLGEKFHHLGKENCRVYVYKTHQLYRENPSDEVAIIINCHYPELRSILFNPTASELQRAIIQIANVQVEEPEEIHESKLIFSPVTGGYEKVEIDSKKKPQIKKEEKKGDLE